MTAFFFGCRNMISSRVRFCIGIRIQMKLRTKIKLRITILIRIGELRFRM